MTESHASADVVMYAGFAFKIAESGSVVLLENVPLEQAVHVPPSRPMYPALHLQFVWLVQPLHEAPESAGHVKHIVRPVVLEKVPAGQAVHAALPVVVLKVLATQAVHVPPLMPVYPALHVQAARAELAMVELELDGHTRQVAASVAPVVGEYDPVGHSVHAWSPTTSLYVPALQAVH